MKLWRYIYVIIIFAPHRVGASYKVRGDRQEVQPCDIQTTPTHCLVLKPHGTFAGEFELELWLSEDEEDLIVRVFGGKAGAGGWVSLGISPNGRMAGPSEAIIGVGGDSPHVARYHMGGYQSSSVSLLPKQEQLLRNASVESDPSTNALIMHFRRPLHQPLQPVPSTFATVDKVAISTTWEMADSFGKPSSADNKADFLDDDHVQYKGLVATTPMPGDAPGMKCEGALTDVEQGSCQYHQPVERENIQMNKDRKKGQYRGGDKNGGLVRDEIYSQEGDVVGDEEQNTRLKWWLNPRTEGMFLLWAYGRNSWPGYHDAAGSFKLAWLLDEQNESLRTVSVPALQDCC
ncbi:unnamed protein product [Choristocarpus tenellus]